jgi:uracil-DNA glycosylase
MLSLAPLLSQIRACTYCAAHLPQGPRPVVQAVAAAQQSLFPLPHPSWRSTLWMRKNPWFAADVLPQLRSAVDAALGG